MDIHDYKSDDLRGTMALLGQLWPELKLDAEKMKVVLEHCRASDSFALFCAEDGGRLVGLCEVHFRESLWRQGMLAYVDVLVVDQAKRRTGIGSALLAVVLGRARRAGCDYVEFDSAFHREEAHLFYEAHGFKKTGFTFGKPVPS